MTITVSEATLAIQQGAIIAYPTEGVFGLGCNPQNSKAVQQLVDLKKRDLNKGLILIASSFDQLAPFLGTLSVEQKNSALHTWPGPVTWIVPAAADINPLLSGNRQTIAVRVSDHPVVQALCSACGHALVSTSANTSGMPTLAHADDIQQAFGAAIAGVVEGALGGRQQPSEIHDIATGAQLR